MNVENNLDSQVEHTSIGYVLILEIFLAWSIKDQWKLARITNPLKVSAVQCHSIPSINTLNQHLDWHSDGYSVDSRWTLHQWLVNSLPSVDRLSGVNRKLVNSCQQRCRWSVNRVADGVSIEYRYRVLIDAPPHMPLPNTIQMSAFVNCLFFQCIFIG